MGRADALVGTRLVFLSTKAGRTPRWTRCYLPEPNDETARSAVRLQTRAGRRGDAFGVTERAQGTDQAPLCRGLLIHFCLPDRVLPGDVLRRHCTRRWRH